MTEHTGCVRMQGVFRGGISTTVKPHGESNACFKVRRISGTALSGAAHGWGQLLREHLFAQFSYPLCERFILVLPVCAPAAIQGIMAVNPHITDLPAWPLRPLNASLAHCTMYYCVKVTSP